ncbi:hypothetical protein [Serinibacter arcticus]|uniref:Uncharacterized protein n=1 Tax=Serinibacter arcticus TaxID=1655435 RepID=A0A4Z1E4I1_9MICO|nr:hypothetical protein [Serinibacter arcticus]TGO05383.1 hypothetical protein SERN_1387 [Serinibacter arcticus]
MRRTGAALAAALLVTALAACSPGGETAPPASSEPAPETSTSSEPATQPTESETEGTDDGEVTAIPTEALPETLLPADLLGTPDQPREEAQGVAPWLLPETCEQVTPDAVDMWTVTQGSGEAEEPVGVHQVAVFLDADAAVAGADALVAAFASCAPSEGAPTIYAVEPLDIGAQGTGLATDYNGVSAGGDLDTALGSYLAETRRGTAVTLTGFQGGEAQVGTSRADTTALLAGAWERLCAYDSEGC